MIKLLLFLHYLVLPLSAFHTNQLPGRNVIVHLFEWKFSDIAIECEEWLGPKGFGAVQISPPGEHLAFTGHPWWERYQPISYKIKTRSGDLDDLLNMTKRCNAMGVRIYADVVINHMAGENPEPVIGTADSYAYPDRYDYPAIPYTDEHFNTPCKIEDWNDPYEMRNCQVSELRDLNQSKIYVREKIADFLNELIDNGVAGFRIDSAKHMWPSDLEAIYSDLHDLNVQFGFAPKTRPFFYHEIVDYGSQSGDLGRWDYTPLGLVTDFMIAGELGRAFRGYYELKWLKNWGEQWNFLPSIHSIVFADEHEFQRGYGYGGTDALTYKLPKKYKMANAFLLAHPHGTPRLMSSYSFQHNEQGPPQDIYGNIVSPMIQSDGFCANGWICEHRWPAIANMVGFRMATDSSRYCNWWHNGKHQIAFSRGESGFIAWNGEDYDMIVELQTCMSPGLYCDVISGELTSGKCTGKKVEINEFGITRVRINGDDENGILAIHRNSAVRGYSIKKNIRQFIESFWETDCFWRIKNW